MSTTARVFVRLEQTREEKLVKELMMISETE